MPGVLRARSAKLLHLPWAWPPRPGRLESRHLVIAVLAVLIVVGGAMRYREIGKNQRVSADEMSYAGLANSIASGHGYLGQIHWAPGAPYVFALFSRLEGSTIRIGPHARSPAQAAQLVIGLATLVLAAFG
ncbi:MAG TPA: hypothetical protein VHW26_03290, partial [Solirubrobacteraceae bacterium]|nr:hypothetical protein [Solirubrobacteraceae bacterium]